MDTPTKIAVVTGAGSGIGRATAHALLADGWAVVLAGRRREMLEETAALAEAPPPRTLVVPTDIRDPAAVAASSQALTELAAQLVDETHAARKRSGLTAEEAQSLKAREHQLRQVLANGFIRTVQYPPGPIHLPVPPVLFDEEAGDIDRAPDFCEHTDEVLSEAGYTPEDLGRLRADGVIA